MVRNSASKSICASKSIRVFVAKRQYFQIIVTDGLLMITVIMMMMVMMIIFWCCELISKRRGLRLKQLTHTLLNPRFFLFHLFSTATK